MRTRSRCGPARAAAEPVKGALRVVDFIAPRVTSGRIKTQVEQEQEGGVVRRRVRGGQGRSGSEHDGHGQDTEPLRGTVWSGA